MRHSFIVIVGGAAGVEAVVALLHRQWFVAIGGACLLLIAIAAARTLTNTHHDHARRALRAAGILAGMCTLLVAASLVNPHTEGDYPISAMFVISVILVAAVFGAVFGGGSYLAITALGAAWDAAVAGIKGRLRGHR